MIVNDREVTTVHSVVPLDSWTVGRSTRSMLPAYRNTARGGHSLAVAWGKKSLWTTWQEATVEVALSAKSPGPERAGKEGDETFYKYELTEWN